MCAYGNTMPCICSPIETNIRSCSTAKLLKPRMTAGCLAGPPVDSPAPCQPQCMPRLPLCCCLLPLPYVFTSPPQCSLLILRGAHCHCNSRTERGPNAKCRCRLAGKARARAAAAAAASRLRRPAARPAGRSRSAWRPCLPCLGWSCAGSSEVQPAHVAGGHAAHVQAGANLQGVQGTPQAHSQSLTCWTPIGMQKALEGAPAGHEHRTPGPSQAEWSVFAMLSKAPLAVHWS